MRDTVRAARRLNPDRLIVGEVVGGEIVALLEALTQGNDGGLTTIHSRSARQVPQRVATYGLAEGVSVEHSNLMLACGVDFIVHMARRRTPDGRLVRWVESVVEVTGYDGVHVMTSELWATAPGATMAAPTAQLTQARADRLCQTGWSPGLTSDPMSDSPVPDSPVPDLPVPEPPFLGLAVAGLPGGPGDPVWGGVQVGPPPLNGYQYGGSRRGGVL